MHIKTIIRYFFAIMILFTVITCKSKTGKNSTPSVNNIKVEQISKNDNSKFEQIDLFTASKTYDNNLSTIASEIKFVQLDTLPVISGFHTLDVEISDEYIFLQGIGHIYQFDKKGKFIRNIGTTGRGPYEYLNIAPPLQLDLKNNLIYVAVIKLKKIFVFNFGGEFIRKIDVEKRIESIQIIDSTIIALRQMPYSRFTNENKTIRFINYKGKEIKSYSSQLKLPEKGNHDHFGAPFDFLWQANNVVYSLEYGADTIFRVNRDSLIPARVLMGNLKPTTREYFSKLLGAKLCLGNGISRPECGIFESDNFIIFRLHEDKSNFLKVFNKNTKEFHRTFYENSELTRRGIKKMDFFTDDVVSGLPFDPQYQSQQEAIALIPAFEIYNKKDCILESIKNNPSKEAEKLKDIVQNITEMDNPVVMIIKFK